MVTFLANADVALSVMMTTVSTLAAVVMTPLLTKALVGALVPVDAKALFMSTIQVHQTALGRGWVGTVPYFAAAVGHLRVCV